MQSELREELQKRQRWKRSGFWTNYFCSLDKDSSPWPQGSPGTRLRGSRLTSGTSSEPIQETFRTGARSWGNDELKRVYFSWIRADFYLGSCSRFTHVHSWLVVVLLRGAEMLAPKSSPLPSKSARLLLMSLDLPTFTEVCRLYTLAELNNILWIPAEKKKKKIKYFWNHGVRIR